MPHQCVRCNTFYDDGSNEILNGCSCGAKLFFYVRKDALERSRKTLETVAKLSEPQKIEMEKDVFDLMGETRDEDLPVILDLEAIRILEPGKFELDLVKLFKKEPLVYQIGSGKYIIDLSTLFKESGRLKIKRPKKSGKAASKRKKKK